MQQQLRPSGNTTSQFYAKSINNVCGRFCWHVTQSSVHAVTYKRNTWLDTFVISCRTYCGCTAYVDSARPTFSLDPRSIVAMSEQRKPMIVNWLRNPHPAWYRILDVRCFDQLINVDLSLFLSHTHGTILLCVCRISQKFQFFFYTLWCYIYSNNVDDW